jgi:hypothetical protein
MKIVVKYYFERNKVLYVKQTFDNKDEVRHFIVILENYKKNGCHR